MVAPLVSIIIPVRNDAESLARLLAQVLEASAEGTTSVAPYEIIVSTTHDNDPAIESLRRARTDVRWIRGPAGRATQLNAGAAQATGEWLWFVHADSVLPAGWLDAFHNLDATGPRRSKTGDRRPKARDWGPPETPRIVGGSFRFALRSPAWQARVIERSVASRVRWLNLPYGDQGIFVRRSVFSSMSGFAPLPLLEDVELVGRLKRLGTLRHLTLSLATSARRWERDGWWRRTAGNVTILGLYWLGVSPERLARRYYRE